MAIYWMLALALSAIVSYDSDAVEDLSDFRRLLNLTCSKINTQDLFLVFQSKHPSHKMIAYREAFFKSVHSGTTVNVLKIIMNHENAGFFAYVTFALNQILYAEQYGFFPVVSFGPTSGCHDCEKNRTCDLCGTNAYYDQNYGENTWEYYFEQPGLVSLSQIEGLQRNGSNIKIHTLSNPILWNIHLREPNAIYTHGYGFFEDADPKTFYYDHGWFQNKRVLAHSVLSDYVRFQPKFRLRVEAMLLKLQQFPCLLGVHIRATDKGIWGGARKVCKRKLL